MDKRFRKKILYGAFYLSVLVGIISLFYFALIKPAPSCFDGIRNQGEEGIDCGTVCSNVCIPQNIKPLSAVDRPLIFQFPNGHLSVLGSVSNPNVGYASKSFSYTFILYDDKGTVLQQFTGNSYIYGGQVKYLLLPNITTVNGVSYAEVKFGRPQWIPASDFPGPPRLEITGIKTDASGIMLAANGQITDMDTVAFPKIEIVTIFKGTLGQVAGASQTEIDNLAPNESRTFTVLYPQITNLDQNGTKVFAYAERQ
ncbi:MAG: hypothetical protein KGJ89_00475 [Patescibacteria group bacterium]|nr:hypothetical protein [Patescibacteria group bacterium]MDE2014995.1 hypothetical protein [Patescibacteria group bacterium]MDE2226424.1 hypothetical protein [Patescibacteria group bacterium]